MIVKLKNTSTVAFIDDEDYPKVKLKQWREHIDKRTSYAVSVGKRGIRMHRFILNIVSHDIRIDHIDGNGLNNIKSNLRKATISENNSNRRVSKTKKSSKYLGVHLDKNKWWFAAIKINGKSKKVYCKTEELAALKYNELAIIYHKEFAKLNIIA